jgi:hypothetical protein
MAEHGPKSPSLRPRASEGFQQHVTVVALSAVDHWSWRVCGPMPTTFASTRETSAGV